jgi:uncharacterized protein YbcI
VSTSTATPTHFAATVASERAVRPRDELARLCGEVATVFRRAWGRGPVKTTAHWAGRNMLVVVLENGHTDAEKTLRATGHGEQLVAGRQLLHQILEDELKSSVERNTGRQVKAMLSATRLDPDLSAEIFLLASTDSDEQTDGQNCLTDRAEKTTMRAP